MNFYDLIYIEPNVIPEHAVRDLLSYSNNESFTATVMDNNGLEKVSKDRVVDIVPLPDSINDLILQNTANIVANKISSRYNNSTLKSISHPEFLKYRVGGKYIEHNDSEDWGPGNKLRRIIDRDISILYYLNDDYEGGELEFTQLGVTIKPKKGMMVAFPSYFEYTHRVHPVTKGTRYTIVTWVETENRIYIRDDRLSSNQRAG